MPLIRRRNRKFILWDMHKSQRKGKYVWPRAPTTHPNTSTNTPQHLTPSPKLHVYSPNILTPHSPSQPMSRSLHPYPNYSYTHSIHLSPFPAVSASKHRYTTPTQRFRFLQSPPPTEMPVMNPRTTPNPGSSRRREPSGFPKRSAPPAAEDGHNPEAYVEQGYRVRDKAARALHPPDNYLHSLA